MQTNSMYREEARRSLSGKWMTSALFFFVYFLITCAVSGFFSYASKGSASLLGTLLILPIYFSVEVGFLRQLRGETVRIEWMFDYYNKRVWVTQFLRYLFVLLWSLLLLIPGIMKSYSYAMVSFVLEDNPALSGREALDQSEALMRGHRMQLFLLDLSFLGWILLSMFTLGIGYMFVASYVASAHAAFYEDLKN